MSENPDVVRLDAELRALREALLRSAARRVDAVASTHPEHRASATNLLHYLELRRHDIRTLQDDLAARGLSSLGRSEAHVLASLDTVIERLGVGPRPVSPPEIMTIEDGPARLEANTTRLLGSCPHERSTRIMVTMPSEAADDPALVRGLVERGMDLARVNCAHDDEHAWARMIDNVQRAAGERAMRVAMDLAGPKLRTGPIAAGPRVRRLAPTRDRLGRVTQPRLVELRATPGEGPPSAHIVLPVTDADWVARRTVGEVVALVDTRGARRTLQVVEVADAGCIVSIEHTTYVEAGTKLTAGGRADDAAVVGELPETEQSHRVRRGDRVVLTRDLTPVAPVAGATVHRIGCTLPDVFVDAAIGERVWLDDGKIGGEICRRDGDELEMLVTDVRPGGANLKAGKGINLPDTCLSTDALTDKDLVDLEFVARHADIVNLSFVRETHDVDVLRDALARIGAPDVGIVLKIENVRAFENLPELLLCAMQSRVVGVMIARGDLAVEVGFERLVEVQEEILWVCEAAHVPVIWATQVLDTLARTGRASRAEVTDAASGQRAECVMLNKGPYIADAVVMLDSILTRMHEHQDKKRSLLRRLRSWDHEVASPIVP